jgi:hypothetical protein
MTEWYVLCSPDRYCIIWPVKPGFPPIPPDHRVLTGALNSEDEAIKWRVENCIKYQPDPNHPPDWHCK